jgi:hypothetical protein
MHAQEQQDEKMPLSPEDTLAQANGFVDAEELEACRDASLSQSRTPTWEDQEWLTGSPCVASGGDVSKTPSDVA